MDRGVQVVDIEQASLKQLKAKVSTVKNGRALFNFKYPPFFTTLTHFQSSFITFQIKTDISCHSAKRLEVMLGSYSRITGMMWQFHCTFQQSLLFKIQHRNGKMAEILKCMNRARLKLDRCESWHCSVMKCLCFATNNVCLFVFLIFVM